VVEKVAWNFNISIEKGPSMSLADSFETEAYDKISVQIEAGANDKSVAIQPSALDKINFICIKSNQYGPDPPDVTKTITYKCGNGDPITLDQAHVLIGTSLIGLLQNVQTFKFTNTTDDPADIEVLLGREAFKEEI